jgi:hypothetical protein
MPRSRGSRRGKLTYTLEEAERRLPFILKRIALSCIDCAAKLDKYPSTSLEIESLVYTIEGLSGHLRKLYSHICREAVKSKQTTDSID